MFFSIYSIAFSSLKVQPKVNSNYFFAHLKVFHFVPNLEETFVISFNFSKYFAGFNGPISAYLTISKSGWLSIKG